MSYTLEHFVQQIESARQFFLKHIDAIDPAIIDWKGGPDCKSIRETLQHLIEDDRASLEALRTGQMPDFANINEPETDWNRLLELLSESHAALTAFIRDQFADTPLDSPVTLWGQPMLLGDALAHLTHEDHFHAGQVTYIRLINQPEWDYYQAIYGTPEV